MDKVLKQLRHKRFRTINEVSPMLSPWCVQANKSIVPIGIEYDDMHWRPECIYT